MRKIISYILKAITFIAGVIGVALSIDGIGNEFMSGAKALMYFTIQSNIAIALVAFIGIFLMAFKKRTYAWGVIQLVFTISITLTGLVYCIMLAPVLGSSAWSIENVLAHVVVPVSAVADFFVEERDYQFRKKDFWYVCLPPIAYCIYAGIGYDCNWTWSTGENYPYFFLNWGSPAGAFGFSKELPYLGSVYWILILAAGVLGFGLIYLVLANLTNKKRVSNEGK